MAELVYPETRRRESFGSQIFRELRGGKSAERDQLAREKFNLQQDQTEFNNTLKQEASALNRERYETTKAKLALDILARKAAMAEQKVKDRVDASRLSQISGLLNEVADLDVASDTYQKQKNKILAKYPLALGDTAAQNALKQLDSDSERFLSQRLNKVQTIDEDERAELVRLRALQRGMEPSVMTARAGGITEEFKAPKEPSIADTATVRGDIARTEASVLGLDQRIAEAEANPGKYSPDDLKNYRLWRSQDAAKLAGYNAQLNALAPVAPQQVAPVAPAAAEPVLVPTAATTTQPDPEQQKRIEDLRNRLRGSVIQGGGQ